MSDDKMLTIVVRIRNKRISIKAKSTLVVVCSNMCHFQQTTKSRCTNMLIPG